MEQYYEREEWGLGFTTKDSIAIGADPEEGTPAREAKLQAHDVIKRANGAPIREARDIVNAIRGSKGKPLTLMVSRLDKDTNTVKDDVPVIVTPTQDKASGNYMIGAPLETLRLVDHVDEASQAYAAGMREGDYFHSFLPSDDHWEDDKLTFSKGKLSWVKDIWNKKERENPTSVELTGVKRIESGGGGGVVLEHPSMYPYRAAGGVWDALSVSWNDTLRGAGSVFTVLHGLLTGNLSPKALSGPLGIGKLIFKVSRSQAFIRYLWFLGFISLNLGVLQFVPIPLLDGWHLVEVFIEKLKGSPITPKVQQAFQLVGLVIVGTLLLYATFQDIMR